jgi:hypothetical protein
MRENIIRTKSFDFAVRIVKLNKHLVDMKKEYVMAKQLLKSGTAVGGFNKGIRVCGAQKGFFI